MKENLTARDIKMIDWGWTYEGHDGQKKVFSMDAGSFVDKINRDLDLLYDKRDEWWTFGGRK